MRGHPVERPRSARRCASTRRDRGAELIVARELLKE